MSSSESDTEGSTESDGDYAYDNEPSSSGCSGNTRSRIVGVEINSGKKGDKSVMSVGRVMRINATPGGQNSSVTGISVRGDGETQIRAPEAEINLGDADGHLGNPSGGGELAAIRTNDASRVALTVPDLVSQVNPGQGETMVVLAAADTSTLSVDGTAYHTLGPRRFPRDVHGNENREAKNLVRREKKNMASKQSNLASNGSLPEGYPLQDKEAEANGRSTNPVNGPRGTGVVSEASGGGKIEHKGKMNIRMNPSAHQDFKVEKALSGGTITSAEGAVTNVYMGNIPASENRASNGESTASPLGSRPTDPSVCQSSGERDISRQTTPSGGNFPVPSPPATFRGSTPSALRERDEDLFPVAQSSSHGNEEAANVVFHMLSQIINGYLFKAVKLAFAYLGTWFGKAGKSD